MSGGPCQPCFSVLLWLERTQTLSTVMFLVLAEYQQYSPSVGLLKRFQSKHVPSVQILLPLAGVDTV